MSTFYAETLARILESVRHASQPIGVGESVAPDGTAMIRLGGVPSLPVPVPIPLLVHLPGDSWPDVRGRLGRLSEAVEAGQAVSYNEASERWHMMSMTDPIGMSGIAVTAGVQDEEIIIQVAGPYIGVLSQRPAMVTEFSGILPPCPATLDNANIAILGPEVLPSLSFRHITEAERAALQPLAVFPPALPYMTFDEFLSCELSASPCPPGSLCEGCLDAPACVLMPAPWGGDMGVCMMCAKQCEAGVAMTGDVPKEEAWHSERNPAVSSVDASED